LGKTKWKIEKGKFKEVLKVNLVKKIEIRGVALPLP
jgi:hypothetical protein